MIIFPNQNPADRFVTTPKALFEDPAISWKAKGMIAWLASHSAQYTFHVSTLIKYSKEGRDSVYSGLKEICSSAYGRKVQERTDDGTFGKSHYLISSEPHNADEWQAMIDGLEFDVLEKSEHKGEKLTRNGKPAHGEIEAHAEKPAMAAFETGSGFSGHGDSNADFPTATASGKTVYGFSDTKKIKSKKIKTTTTEPARENPIVDNSNFQPYRPSSNRAQDPSVAMIGPDEAKAIAMDSDEWAFLASGIPADQRRMELIKFFGHNDDQRMTAGKWLATWGTWAQNARRGTQNRKPGQARAPKQAQIVNVRAPKPL